MSFKHSLKWSFLSEITSRVITPVVFIVLGRLLTPEDFGVMAAALMVMSFSQIFWEAGMGKALIQRQTETNEAANVAFWINAGLGVVISIILFVLAGVIAHTFFHDERVTAVLQVMTIQIILGSFASVHTALMQKNMLFKDLFWMRFATTGVPALASIPLAWYGLGYWSLVAGNLIGQFAQVIILWTMNQWRPQFSFHVPIAKQMVRFSVWVSTTGLMSWFFCWIDALIIGMYLGVHELGLFRMGNQFVSVIFGMLLGALVPVLYSHLVRMNQDYVKVQAASLKVIKSLTFIAVPIGFMLLTLSEPISSVLLGEKWQGVGFVIGVMALVNGFSWVVGMNGEIYRAMNKPSYETILASSTMIIYIGAYFYSIQYGLEVFLWTRFGLSMFGVVAHLFMLKKLLGIRILPSMLYIAYVALGCGISMLVVDYVVIENVSGAMLQAILGTLLCGLLFACALYIFERNGILKDLQGLVTKK